MINLFKALFEHKAGGFFATDAAGAEHRYFFVLFRVVVLAHVLGKFAESGGLRVYRPLKATYRHFVIVAGIDHQHFRVGDDVIPVFRLDVGAHGVIRIDVRHAEGNNFFFEFDLGAVERRFVAIGLFVINIGQAGISSQPGK